MLWTNDCESFPPGVSPRDAQLQCRRGLERWFVYLFLHLFWLLSSARLTPPSPRALLMDPRLTLQPSPSLPKTGYLTSSET